MLHVGLGYFFYGQASARRTYEDPRNKYWQNLLSVQQDLSTVCGYEVITDATNIVVEVE